MGISPLNRTKRDGHASLAMTATGTTVSSSNHRPAGPWLAMTVTQPAANSHILFTKNQQPVGCGLERLFMAWPFYAAAIPPG